ncbi:MAG: multidrug effflux MFS transporter [Bacteroidota bacterium]|nr:multidrug effflux MFS transporter [Ferruginibacter sp.]
MKGKRKFLLILILGMITAIGPFSIDMYLPAFAGIATDLDTTVAEVSLSLSSFFIGISIGQFIYGPLLDRYGRKKPLYLGLGIYLVASMLCALATSIEVLIGLRFLQALGGCAGMVASRAMVRDLFSVEDNAKVFSMLMLVVGVSPIIAPTLGGFIASEYGWHYVFIVLTIMAVVILLSVYFGLPETRKPDASYSLRPRSIVTSYWSVLNEPQFYVYAFTGAIAAAGLYAYISGSPTVFLEIYKVTEQEYGWIFALVAGGLIVSSQLNSVLLRKYRSEQIIPVALFCQGLTGLSLFLGSAYGWIGLTGTIILILIFLSCQGFTFPNSSALSMAPFSQNAGSASALMGAIQMGIGALTSAIVSLLSNGTALPMTGVMAVCAITSFVILMVGGRVIRYKASKLEVEEETVEMICNS